MSTLIKLQFLKVKALIRHLYSKPSSAILTSLVIFFYGVLIYFSAKLNNGLSVVEPHSTAMLVVSAIALLALGQLGSKRLILIKETDAYMLFTGPFTDRQIMLHIVISNLSQSLLLALYPMYFLTMLIRGISFGFIVFSYVFSFIFFFVFALLLDILHVWEIRNPKNQWVRHGLLAALILFVALVFFINCYEMRFDFSLAFATFMRNPLLHFIPLFGWLKLALVAYIRQEWLFVILSVLLMVISGAVAFIYFLNLKNDFYEKAYDEAEQFTAVSRKMKRGENIVDHIDQKIVGNGEFKEGAWAILSKNLLLMKRSKNLLPSKVLIMITAFFVLSILMDMGSTYFLTTSFMVAFFVVNDFSLENELKNYQIYLIPDSSFKKGLACVLPYILKEALIIAVVAVLCILGYHMPISELLPIIINLFGASLTMVAGTMVSFKLLKSRSSAAVEQMLRMLLMIILLIPSAVITAFALVIFGLNVTLLTILPLIINLLLSILLLRSASSIFNGSDLLAE